MSYSGDLVAFPPAACARLHPGNRNASQSRFARRDGDADHAGEGLQAGSQKETKPAKKSTNGLGKACGRIIDDQA
jgi:hypothetical protein